MGCARLPRDYGEAARGREMCLDLVTKRSPRQQAVRVAYKLVEVRSPKAVYGAHLKVRIRLSWWAAAREQLLQARNCGNNYVSGFHVFARQEDAQRQGWAQTKTVIPVKVRHIHTVGKQWGCEVWVTQEMFVAVADVRKALAAR